MTRAGFDTRRPKAPGRLASVASLALLASLASLAVPVGMAIGMAVALPAATAAPAGPLKLHVPSPDWRDQVIYFLMTDRFDDGNPRNNDQGQGEYKPGDDTRWQGGDFAGLMRRLDYIRGLGATAVWITPPIANRAWAPSLNFSGYHGYWPEHFKQVDPHLGTLADYKRLSHELHRRGMYLVQDIVVNHTADYFHYAAGWDASDPTRFYAQNPDARGRVAPRQWPFSLNDPRRARDRAAAVFNWTPDITNYQDKSRIFTHQMSGLDDLNFDSPLVRRALRDSHAYWIREVGVDAFRIDTAFYVPPSFYADFVHARDARAPGMLQAARATGRRDFHLFGEGFGIDRAGETTQMRRIDSYLRDGQGRALLPGMLHFPLYGSFNQVFARGAPTEELAHRIEATLSVHADPHRLVTFLDNHDVDRFLASGDEAGLRQALLAMFTLPGIPTVYYGTEQGFKLQRASMFAAGVGSGGRDHFDAGHPLYRTIARLAQLRREHRVLSRGTPRVVVRDATGAGALMWAMEGGGAGARGERLFVAFNTARHPVLVDNAALGVPAGARLEGLLALDGEAPALTTGADGRVSFQLPARAGWVWRLQGPPGMAATVGSTAAVATAPVAALATALAIDPLPAVVSDDVEITGRAAAGQRLQVVVDGRLHEAQTVQADAQGRWRARIDTATMVDPALLHRVVAWADGAASPAQGFRVQRQWQLAADVEDPAGDDRGPGGAAGRYTYPTDPGWGANRQLDLRRLRVYTAGGAMRIEVSTPHISTGWNPPNGFDRVAFTVFIELPGQPAGSGATVLPLQRAELPAGMRWHRRIRAHGWSNALYEWPGADAQNEGTPAPAAARIEVDRASHTVRFTLPAVSLGRLPSLTGARVYVATWDYDAAFRGLAKEAAGYTFGGAQGEADPLVMDSVGPVELR